MFQRKRYTSGSKPRTDAHRQPNAGPPFSSPSACYTEGGFVFTKLSKNESVHI